MGGAEARESHLVEARGTRMEVALNVGAAVAPTFNPFSRGCHLVARVVAFVASCGLDRRAQSLRYELRLRETSVADELFLTTGCQAEAIFLKSHKD